MRRAILAFCIISFLFSPFVFAADMSKYGTLKVICDNERADIYIDGGLAGRSPVTIENIQAGTHYIKVSIKDRTIYDKIIAIQEGQQETVVVKAEINDSVDEPTNNTEILTHSHQSSQSPFGITMTYGNYSAIASTLGYSASATSDSFFGLGIRASQNLPDTNNSYYVAGFHYNTRIGGVQISYAYLDLGLKSESIFTELGINYPLIDISGISGISGNLGYQLSVGLNLAQDFGIGIKYGAYNSTWSVSGTPVDLNFIHTMIFIKLLN